VKDKGKFFLIVVVVSSQGFASPGGSFRVAGPKSHIISAGGRFFVDVNIKGFWEPSHGKNPACRCRMRKDFRTPRCPAQQGGSTGV